MTDSSGLKHVPKLPFRIDRIKPQLGHPDRVNLYQNDTFMLGVAKKALEKSGLKEGDWVSDDHFKKLTESDTNEKLREHLLRYLARRAHSRVELQQKAQRKSYSLEEIQPILDEFTQKGWIDDAAFTESYIRSKVRTKWGPLKIQAGLLQAGIPKSTANLLIHAYFENHDQFEIMEAAFAKKRNALRREKDPQKRRQKLYLFLTQKGFPSSEIHAHAAQLLDSL